jgi:putative tryptophan/tyrosine transport system substrate-binding protein
MPLAKKTIGFLGACNLDMWGDWLAAFQKQLATDGWTSDNCEIICRWADGLEKNYTEYAKFFVGRKVDVIVTGGTQCTTICKKFAAKANPPIPVVFATAGDPIDTKLVSSFSAPGNLTGMCNQQTNLVIKRLDILRLLAGKAPIGLIGNDKSANVKLEMKVAKLVAPTFGLKILERHIRRQKDIAPVIKSLKGKVKALFVCTDPLITTCANEVNTAANDAELATLHAFREYLKHGGLMSYGPKFVELFQNAATLVNMILRGQAGPNMAYAPVSQTNDFEYVINLPVFQKIGLAVPQSLLALADDIIK